MNTVIHISDTSALFVRLGASMFNLENACDINVNHVKVVNKLYI
jgi:hypothetical protein